MEIIAQITPFTQPAQLETGEQSVQDVQLPSPSIRPADAVEKQQVPGAAFLTTGGASWSEPLRDCWRCRCCCWRPNPPRPSRAGGTAVRLRSGRLVLFAGSGRIVLLTGPGRVVLRSARGVLLLRPGGVLLLCPGGVLLSARPPCRITLRLPCPTILRRSTIPPRPCPTTGHRLSRTTTHRERRLTIGTARSAVG